MPTKNFTREFNRLYSNLNELFRRIYDAEHEYPSKTCAIWFVDDLNTLMSDAKLISMLTSEQIDNIVEKSIMLRKTNLIDINIKRELSLMVKQLKEFKNTKSNVMEV